MGINILFNCLIASNALIYCDYALRFVPKTVTAKFLGTSAYVGFLASGFNTLRLRPPIQIDAVEGSINIRQKH